MLFAFFRFSLKIFDFRVVGAIDAAVKALAAATDDATKKTAQEALDAVMADAGQVFLWGAIDFAGGTVVHINAGIAGLVGCIMVGKRIGIQPTARYVLDAILLKNGIDPASLTITNIGFDMTPLKTGQVDAVTGWITTGSAPKLLLHARLPFSAV